MRRNSHTIYAGTCALFHVIAVSIFLLCSFITKTPNQAAATSTHGIARIALQACITQPVH